MAVPAHSTPASSRHIPTTYEGPFDPYEFVAAYRRLGAEFWCIRDKRTGKVETRASLYLDPPPGMTEDEFTETLHALMLWVQSDPNAMAKVGAVVRAEGVIHYPVETPSERAPLLIPAA